MIRTHNINGVKFPFTSAEEAARDIEEQTWVDGAIDRAWEVVRSERDRLLDDHDKKVSQYNRNGRTGRQNPHTITELDAYANALADITTDFPTPDDVVFPTPPT